MERLAFTAWLVAAWSGFRAPPPPGQALAPFREQRPAEEPVDAERKVALAAREWRTVLAALGAQQERARAARGGA